MSCPFMIEGPAASRCSRIFRASLRRSRPAIMTTTTLVSLVPILWSTGRGTELMQPMVLPVIGDILFDFISLFAIPVFYVWHWDRKFAREPETGRLPEGAPVPAD
jgi:copper/silver efflux system protein